MPIKRSTYITSLKKRINNLGRVKLLLSLSIWKRATILTKISILKSIKKVIIIRVLLFLVKLLHNFILIIINKFP